MLTILALLALALVLMVIAPAILTRGCWQVMHPRTALALWYGSFLLGCSALAASMIFAVLSGINAGHAQSPPEAIFLTILAWMTLAITGGFIAFIAMSSEPILRSYKRSTAQITPLIHSQEERSRFILARFHSDEYVACTFPGREPLIVVSSALEDALTPPQFQAVLAHEYAHLRQRHGWITRIAEINALCVPRLAAGRSLLRATLLLVELIADDTAARQAGPVHLANALSRLGHLSGDDGMEFRAQRIAQQRWSRRRRVVPATLKTS
ncbi:M56 family metallopeptidase [Lysinibacter sp. HNR]|uniref:M56 family metallopeptidase n=1 Tax=Lysinibacter sp. HNR TaxID=3031408 RepID=UPI002435D614|nr:M56 family metallopeptidase [Lysinibacter sp. HNR]WGD36955.1 M56 family metallopeptidase [Lysinibacter sp. HNR]